MKINKSYWLIIIVILSLFSTSVLYYKHKNKPITNIIPKNIDELSYTKGIYEKYYSFDSKKLPEDIYFTFTGIDGELLPGFQNYLAEINELPVDISKTEKIYESIDISNKPIDKVSHVERKFLPIENQFPTNETELIKEIKSRLNFESIHESHDYFFSNSDAEKNSTKGDLERYFYPKYNELPVFNLGTSLDADIEKNGSITNITVQQNINERITKEKTIVEPKKLSYAKLQDQIKSKNLRLYRLEFIGSGYTSESPKIDTDLGATSSNIISIETIGSEYFYLWTDSIVVPLLRLNGSVPTKYGPQNITFWAWFLE
jgi:hypothetical protein